MEIRKRGPRRSVSPLVGAWGLMAISAACLVGGLGFLVWVLVYWSLPQWRVRYHFRETVAHVAKVRLKQYEAHDGTTYRPEYLVDFTVDDTPYHVWATYDVTGRFSHDETAMRATLDRFAQGKQYPCWYDPHDPQMACMSRGNVWSPWLVLLLPVSFIAVGGGALIILIFDRGKSVERRAALAARGLPLEMFDGGAPDASADHPQIPRLEHITDSPGTTLKYRLPIDARSDWALGGLLGGVALMNLVAAAFLLLAVRKLWRGEPDWIQLGVTLPWLFVGLWAAVQVARRIVGTTGVGPTLIELSAHPLVLGQRYEALLIQNGRLKFERLRLLLVCQERGTFTQGTNLRIDQRRVFERVLYEADSVEVRQGAPFEIRSDLVLPAHAMHSFQSEHNEVNWSLLVVARPSGWPAFERQFPVVVYPSPDNRRPT